MESAVDRLEAMRTFVQVIETGSLTAAAARLDVGKSVVSRRLADLEAHLGAQLIARSTRRLTPTETGRAFHARCLRILADVEEAEQCVSEAQDDPGGLLRIAAPLSFGLRHLSPALAAFMTDHPRIEIDLDLNDRTVNLVEDGFDLAVRIGRLSDSSLIARRLAPIRRLIVASPAYWTAHGRPGRPAELADHPVLRYANVPASETWSMIRAETGTARPVPPVSRLRANNGDILLDMAEAGLGVAVLPSFLCADALRAGRLEAVLTAAAPAPFDLHVVYPPTRHLSARVRVFIDFLARRFGDPPYWDDGLDLRPRHVAS